jgi:metacaspase-1
MSRQTDLEKMIRTSYEVIALYETKANLSDRPDEIERAKNVIAQHEDQLRRHLEKYLALCAKLKLPIPADIQELVAQYGSSSERPSESSKQPTYPHGFQDGYALIVGIANYPKVKKLPSAVLKDAEDTQRLLISPSRCGYQADHVRLLLDNQATGEQIRKGFAWLAQEAHAKATALVFFSGHGGRLKTETQTYNYLLPYEADRSDISGTAISGEELTGLLRPIKAQRLLVFFDCCYAGGTGETKGPDGEEAEFKSGIDETYYDKLSSGTGRVIIASSRSDEESLILHGMENSLFTHYLLKALEGECRTRDDGLIRVFDLFDYISERVPARGDQHPIFKSSEMEDNFPVVLYLAGKHKTVGY